MILLLPLLFEWVHEPILPFPHILETRIKLILIKIRETFYYIKINIPLLDVFQQMPPYAKFRKIYVLSREPAVFLRRLFELPVLVLLCLIKF